MLEGNLKQKTKIGIFWTFFNQFANNGLQFVVGVIMARLLSPSDYGITALPALFLTIAEVFISGGFNLAMIRKPDLKESDLSTAFIYSISVGAFCYMLVFSVAPYIARFFNEQILVPLIRITALTFLWSPLATPQNILLNRKLDFKTPTKISIATKIIGAITGITIAYMGYGLWALVIMGVTSNLINTLLLWISVRWKPTTGWSKESFKYLWGFGNKLMASSLLDTVYNNITPFIVGKYFSMTDLGVYNRARGYAALPSQQGTNILQQVTFPVLSKIQDDNHALSNGYRKMLKVSAFVIFPIMTLLAALAKPFIIILITEKWAGAIILLRLLCFSMMWFPIHVINLTLLQTKGYSDCFLKLEVLKKCIGLVVMICTMPYGLIYFVSALIVSSFICFFINTYYTGNIINVGFMEQVRDLLPTYCLSIFIFFVVLGMNHFIENLWIQLIVGGCVGSGLYIGIAYIFKFAELQDVKYMFSRNKNKI